jgi:hypothetical protein
VLSIDEVIDVDQVLSVAISDELFGEGLKPGHELHIVEVKFRDEGHVHLCTDHVESDGKRSVCRILAMKTGWLRVEPSGRAAI